MDTETGLETEGFDFVEAHAKEAAATTPLITEKANTAKQVHNAAAEYYLQHPEASVSTEPHPDFEAAMRRYDTKIAAARAQVYAQHAPALEAARVEEGRAFVTSGHAFLSALERFENFEARRVRFQAACGVTPVPSLAKHDLRFELAALLGRVAQAIEPKPSATRVAHVPLSQRIRQLIGA